ncbi:MAG: copper chaperone PCu(A)C, partial [Oceanospirillales bacterium]|nr:copper chaperone PCu(A)C [Oceanospirillales bacterium]
LHVMMIGLNRGLSEGDEISLSLSYSDGSEQTLTVHVRAVMPAGHGGNGMKKMGQQ